MSDDEPEVLSIDDLVGQCTVLAEFFDSRPANQDPEGLDFYRKIHDSTIGLVYVARNLNMRERRYN